MAKQARAPWERSNPRKRSGKASKHLSPREKSAAKARAKRAGRRYPNLVDNMRMAAKKTSTAKSASKARSRKTASAKKTAASAKKTASAKKNTARKPSRKRASRTREKDPRGGLTTAGRKAFAKKEGAHLRPGVTRSESEMTPQDMRRKGSWAVRFYGRKKLPPLIDENGRPTRHALSAHAWGEPVPRTVTAARRIARKGERLLQRYRRLKQKA